MLWHPCSNSYRGMKVIAIRPGSAISSSSPIITCVGHYYLFAESQHLIVFIGNLLRIMAHAAPDFDFKYFDRKNNNSYWHCWEEEKILIITSSTGFISVCKAIATQKPKYRNWNWLSAEQEATNYGLYVSSPVGVFLLNPVFVCMVFADDIVGDAVSGKKIMTFVFLTVFSH